MFDFYDGHQIEKKTSGCSREGFIVLKADNDIFNRHDLTAKLVCVILADYPFNTVPPERFNISADCREISQCCIKWNDTV